MITWVPLLLFVVLGVAAIAIEIFWLMRRHDVSGGRASAFVLATDLFSFVVGFFLSLVVIVVMFMLVMGPSGEGGRPSEVVMWGLLLIGLSGPLLLLLLSKRAMLGVLKILPGDVAWQYSFAAAVLVWLMVTIPPVAAGYVFAYSSLWK
jgi:hypothetical protein